MSHKYPVNIIGLKGTIRISDVITAKLSYHYDI